MCPWPPEGITCTFTPTPLQTSTREVRNWPESRHDGVHMSVLCGRDTTDDFFRGGGWGALYPHERTQILLAIQNTKQTITNLCASPRANRRRRGSFSRFREVARQGERFGVVGKLGKDEQYEEEEGVVRKRALLMMRQNGCHFRQTRRHRQPAAGNPQMMMTHTEPRKEEGGGKCVQEALNISYEIFIMYVWMCIDRYSIGPLLRVQSWRTSG